MQNQIPFADTGVMLAARGAQNSGSWSHILALQIFTPASVMSHPQSEMLSQQSTSANILFSN